MNLSRDDQHHISPPMARADLCEVRDEDLIVQVQNGQRKAYDELVARYKGRLFSFILRMVKDPDLAEELTQETLIRVYIHAAKYREIAKFSTWVFTIATNLVRSHFRKRKVRRIMTGWWRRSPSDPAGAPVPLDPPDPAADPEVRTGDRERVSLIERALADLPDGPRRALLLTRVEGMSLAQAAEALGVGVPTVKTWVRRGRLALAEILARAEDDAGAPAQAASEGQGEGT